MPELPEIATLAAQLEEELCGHRLRDVEMESEKPLNVPPRRLRRLVSGVEIAGFRSRGKWILAQLDGEWELALNLGMGAEIRLSQYAEEPRERYRLRLLMDGGKDLLVRFWWFGHLHVVDHRDVDHPVRQLGPDALSPDLDFEAFSDLLDGRRGGIKSFLLNQRRIAGIGNFYAHDILARAGVHPLRKIPTLSHSEREGVYTSMRELLRESLNKGGADYERDIYGRPGGFSRERFWVGYREDEPCRRCGTTVQKIRTGSTPGYICPTCQPID